jgi:predicted component of type VI protein secretion system
MERSVLQLRLVVSDQKNVQTKMETANAAELGWTGELVG